MGKEETGGGGEWDIASDRAVGRRERERGENDKDRVLERAV